MVHSTDLSSFLTGSNHISLLMETSNQSALDYLQQQKLKLPSNHSVKPEIDHSNDGSSLLDYSRTDCLRVEQSVESNIDQSTVHSSNSPNLNDYNPDNCLHMDVEPTMKMESQAILTFSQEDTSVSQFKSIASLNVEKKIQWKTEEVEALLDCVTDHLDDFRGRMVHVRVWRQIGNHLAGLYTHITPPHCYNKWKNLRRDVRLALSNPQRVLRNPGVLVRAARLAAQVYPTGPEADPEFLRQVDALLTNHSSLIVHPHEKKVKSFNPERKLNGIVHRRKKAASTSISNVDDNSPMDQSIHQVKPDSSYINNNNDHYVPPVSPPILNTNAFTGNSLQQQQHQTNLLASFLQQQQQLSPQSSQRATSTPASTGELNPLLLNQAFLIQSANNMLQKLQQQSSTPPNSTNIVTSTSAHALNSSSNNGISTNGYGHFFRENSPPHQNMNGRHVVSGNNIERFLQGVNGHQYLSAESFEQLVNNSHQHNNRGFTNTPSTQSIPGGISNPSSSPESANILHTNLPPAQPHLSMDHLRDLVLQFRNDESTRISMLENLITLVHDLRTDSQRRLDILNNLMNFTQYGDPHSV